MLLDHSPTDPQEQEQRENGPNFTNVEANESHKESGQSTTNSGAASMTRFERTAGTNWLETLFLISFDKIHQHHLSSNNYQPGTVNEDSIDP